MDALEKLLKGEVVSDEEKAAIPPEKLKEALDAENNKILASITARRQELSRLNEKNVESEKEFSARFKEEQQTKAWTKFTELYAKHLTEEQKGKVRMTWQKLDSGAIDADLIFNDMVSALAASDASTFIKAKEEKERLEKEALEFNSSQAGTQGSGSGGTEGKIYPPEVYDMVKESKIRGLNLTLDEADRSFREGLTRVL